MTMADPKTSRTAVIATVAVVLLVVVGLVLAQALGSDDDGGVSSATGDAASPSVKLPPAGTCDSPPDLPQQPKQFGSPPDPKLAEDTTWTAHVATSCGEIVMELYGDKAPQTVASFLFLAENGYWDDSPCHRLVTQGIFVLQCGDPTGTGSGDPGYGYGVENAPKDYTYPRGTLAMARTSDPNTNGGQFFIVFKKTELPDPTGYSIFGRVTEGMDIVDRIAEKGIGGTLGPEAPKQPISILGISVEKAA
jgi:peptidyl-prolyl cis-trans isomerase B (cyclophilin B)